MGASFWPPRRPGLFWFCKQNSAVSELVLHSGKSWHKHHPNTEISPGKHSRCISVFFLVSHAPAFTQWNMFTLPCVHQSLLTVRSQRPFDPVFSFAALKVLLVLPACPCVFLWSPTLLLWDWDLIRHWVQRAKFCRMTWRINEVSRNKYECPGQGHLWMSFWVIDKQKEQVDAEITQQLLRKLIWNMFKSGRSFFGYFTYFISHQHFSGHWTGPMWLIQTNKK